MGMTGAAAGTAVTNVKPNRDGVPSSRGGGSVVVAEIVELVVRGPYVGYHGIEIVEALLLRHYIVPDLALCEVVF